tara:strand:- start:549 stop:740 length:192 start_codon:yes stop_codon:yes gene_type:complete
MPTDKSGDRRRETVTEPLSPPSGHGRRTRIANRVNKTGYPNRYSMAESLVEVELPVIPTLGFG